MRSPVVEQAGEMVERITGDQARQLVARGFARLVVAGGETSGAVVSALGIDALRSGPRNHAGRSVD